MFYKSIETKCPVCKDSLGWRQKDSLADFYCKECDVTYYWHPNDKKPSNSKGNNKKAPAKCGCGLCSR